MKLFDYLKKPAVAAVLGGVLGLVVGLIWAWGIAPVQWKDVPPTQLGSTYQEEFLRMAIDSYTVHPDEALASNRFKSLGDAGPNVLAAITKNPGNLDATAVALFSNIVQPSTLVATPTPAGGETPAKKISLTSVLLILAAVLLFALVGYGILRYLIPLFRNTGGGETAANRARELTNQTAMKNYEEGGQEPPISQFVTTYVLGDDLFDDSFSIDSPAGEFLGECGVGISETIGVGDPKKVQAFEVWLFDKNDIQTVTKVLMSTHAFNDPATFQRLQAKGEPFQVERGKQVILETAALQLVATVSDAEYGQGALPDESYFDRLTLEIAVWPKPITPAGAQSQEPLP
jgi:hypothetical protein